MHSEKDTSARNSPASPKRGAIRPLSIAPMMDRTDRHYRFFIRLITGKTLLYTEMVTTGALIYGDRPRHLDFSPQEHPIALQLGGDNPQHLADCARMGQDWGYDEVNLNVGCPSNRVQNGSFGACLMKEPERVARAVEAMRQATDLPVTVKHRIGVDELDRYEDMLHFVTVVAEAGCDRFSVHARKAWLNGLSPKENRNVPPLRYEDVHRLKRERPDLDIEINGGFRNLAEARGQLEHVDAIMIGRGAYDDPWSFAAADPLFFDAPAPAASPFEVVRALVPYVERLCASGLTPHKLTRHMLHLFAGSRGTRAWKRHLSQHANRPGAGPEVLLDALAQVERQQG